METKSGSLLHSDSPANTNAQFPNFLSDRVTKKSA